MANHKSAIKRHRQSITRRDRNRVAKLELRSVIKEAREAIDSGKTEQAKELVKNAERKIAKAGNKKILHSKNASRKVSRLYAALSKKSKPLV